MPPPSDIAYSRVRETCLRFPGAEEKLSHGAPAFHVRGKMFLTFVDDHHGDGRLAVWCKSTHDEQRRLVASNAKRFFVPPYVGVKGWVGVIVDPREADWIELSILVEEAWASVAPPRLRNQPLVAEAPPSAIVRVKTDAKVARAALERLSAICLALPDVTCEREAKHATFRVKKKVFVYFLDNHHGDGVVAACVKGDKREHARMIAADPGRFYLPAYIGAHGYLGIRIDSKRVDWKLVEERVKRAYAAARPAQSARSKDPEPAVREAGSRKNRKKKS